jgi:hypothetical protein
VPAPKISNETRPFRLLDATGLPVAEGTRIEARVEWYLDRPFERSFPGINDEPFVEHVVGPDGRWTWTPRLFTVEPYRGALHVRLAEPSAFRSRAFVPWPVDPALAVIELKLEPESLLCSCKFVDEDGHPIKAESLSVGLADARPGKMLDAMRWLGASVNPTDNGYEIRGWQQPGKWRICASYMYRGPSVQREVELGSSDVALILPVTGHVQTQVRLPKHFPSHVLEAVYRHAASGEVSRQPVGDDSSNHRLRAGTHEMRIELAGELLLDMGTVEVPARAQLDVALPLPPLRALHIRVFSTDGAPIPACSARIDGGDERFRFHNDSRRGIVVMTPRESVDLVIESYGYEPARLPGVTGDRRVELRPAKR